MDTINDRMQTLVNAYFDGNQARFAKHVGLPKGSISNYLSKGSKPSVDLLAKIVDLLDDVDVYWLLTGKGNMEKQTTATCENEWERRTQLQHQNNVTQIIALCHKLVDNYQQQNNTIAQLANLLEQLDNNTRQHEPLRETTPQTNYTPEM